MRLVRATLVVMLAAGCPKPVEPVLDAGAPELDAGVDAGVDAGPTPLSFTIDLETVDAGLISGLDAGMTVDSLKSIAISFPVPLDDVRFRVMDWNDAVVASDDELVTDGGLSYRIVFQQPLKTGRGYSLLIDAETGDTFRDSRGAQYDEVRVPFRIGGEVQSEPGAPVKKKKKKK